MFISLEGIDGSGKTSISKMLAKHFEDLGKRVYLTEEPTKIIFDVKEIMEKDLDPFTRMFIFMADRVEHIRVIKEKIKQGYVVICDRYVDSTFAYQGAIIKNKLDGMENAYHYMESIYRPFSFDPDLIIYLDVDPERGLKRIEKRKREYFEDLVFLRDVRDFYIYLSNLRKYMIIDSNSTLEEAWKSILERIRLS